MSDQMNVGPETGLDISELSRNWGWLLGFGILSVVLGMIGLGMVVFITIASVLFFGILLLINGGFKLLESFKCKSWQNVIWHIFIALLYLLAGVATVRNPALASSVFTLVLAWAIIVIGAFRIIAAIQLRGTQGWFWTLLGGIVTLLLGIMILAKWPVSGLWVIGLFISIELIMNGWSSIVIALAVRSARKVSG